MVKNNKFGQKKVKSYQRFLTPDSKPFDPLKLAKEKEKMVTGTGKEGLDRRFFPPRASR